MTGPPAMLNIAPGEALSRPRLEGLLFSLDPSTETDASSLYLKPGGVTDFLHKTRRVLPEWEHQLSQLDGAVLDSDTGLVGLKAGRQGLVILPPFPVLEDRLIDRWDQGPLLELLSAEYTIGVVLLRLGRFSVAVYQGEKLVSSKTDARYVKGRHRAGGSSQRRFERIREGQMRRIYDKACQTARVQFEPYLRQIDYVFLGGERLTLNGFLKVCPFMSQFEKRMLGRRLNNRDPKRDTLEEVGRMLTQSRVYPVQWPAEEAVGQ